MHIVSGSDRAVQFNEEIDFDSSMLGVQEHMPIKRAFEIKSISG